MLENPDESQDFSLFVIFFINKLKPTLNFQVYRIKSKYSENTLNRFIGIYKENIYGFWFHGDPPPRVACR